MKYLIASPDRYGRFGHQTHSILSAILLSYLSGNKTITPKYMFFAEKWNDYVNWSKSKYATNFVNAEANEVTYLKFKNNPDQHGNIKAKPTNANEIKKA